MIQYTVVLPREGWAWIDKALFAVRTTLAVGWLAAAKWLASRAVERHKLEAEVVRVTKFSARDWIVACAHNKNASK